MSEDKTFNSERREKFLTLLEVGRTVQEAAAEVGVTTTTVYRWAEKGRFEEDTERAEFSERFHAIKDGTNEKRLGKDDLIVLLEKSARRGSVQAIKLLLERPWDRQVKEEKPKPKSVIDELAAKRAAG